MKGARSKRYSAYKYQVHVATIVNSPTRAGLTRDHIVPVSFGFKHDIPPTLMGSPENIEYMTLNDNVQKGTRLTPEAIALLKKWGKEYPQIADVAEAYELKGML